MKFSIQTSIRVDENDGKTYAIHLYNNIIEADHPDYLKSTRIETSFISQLESFVGSLD